MQSHLLLLCSRTILALLDATLFAVTNLLGLAKAQTHEQAYVLPLKAGTAPDGIFEKEQANDILRSQS
jgi:hypothetical protein